MGFILSIFYPRQKEKLFPFVFEYLGKANEVFVYGSFSKWISKFKLTKKSPNHFSICLHFPEGEMQFKFIVDKQEKISKNYPRKLLDNEMVNYAKIISEEKKDEIKAEERPNSFPYELKAVPHRNIENKLLLDSNSNCSFGSFANEQFRPTMEHCLFLKKCQRYNTVSYCTRCRDKTVTFIYFKPFCTK